MDFLTNLGAELKVHQADGGDAKCCLLRGIDYSIHCRSLQVDWMSPGKPNGIILGYDLLRKKHSCPKIQKLRKDHSGVLCKAVKCQKPKSVCGHRCYSPEAKVYLFK